LTHKEALGNFAPSTFEADGCPTIVVTFVRTQTEILLTMLDE